MLRPMQESEPETMTCRNCAKKATVREVFNGTHSRTCDPHTFGKHDWTDSL